MSQARIIYLIGPRGAGKESLIRFSRHALAHRNDVCFAHRYITRHPDYTDENYVYLSEPEFRQRINNGLFAMNWTTQDHHYGIGIEIDLWLQKGLTVIVNGSRGYLEQAKLKYPDLVPVLMNVSEENITRRLNINGPSKQMQVAEIVNHFYQIREQCKYDLHTIDNNGTLQQAGTQLVNIINEYGNVTERVAS